MKCDGEIGMPIWHTRLLRNYIAVVYKIGVVPNSSQRSSTYLFTKRHNILGSQLVSSYSGSVSSLVDQQRIPELVS